MTSTTMFTQCQNLSNFVWI